MGEPARPLPRVAEGPRRVRGDFGGRPLEERRRGDDHGAAPAQAFHGLEVAEGRGLITIVRSAFLRLQVIHCGVTVSRGSTTHVLLLRQLDGARQLKVVRAACTACTDLLLWKGGRRSFCDCEVLVGLRSKLREEARRKK